MRTSDTSVHRCPACGTWCYAKEPCTTCAIAAERKEAG